MLVRLVGKCEGQYVWPRGHKHAEPDAVHRILTAVFRQAELTLVGTELAVGVDDQESVSTGETRPSASGSNGRPRLS